MNAIPPVGGRQPGPGAGQRHRGKKCNAGGKGAPENPNHILINRVREEGELLDKDEYWRTDRLGQEAELDYTDWNTPHDTPGWQ